MEENQSEIKRRIEDIRIRVRNAALQAGRDPGEITVIGVTKTIAADRIREAVAAGIDNLGENRVQELLEKYDEIDGKVNWHLIGHLQTNKVKYVIDRVKLIHSLDSLELAEEIQKRAKAAGKVMDVLVQVNVAGEETKFGISPDEVYGFIEKMTAFPNIGVKGLMTVAPLVEDAEKIRHVFRNLYRIFIDIMRKNHDNIDMRFLSMGMSNDFEVAISEGSNMIRIGTSIFGKR